MSNEATKLLIKAELSMLGILARTARDGIKRSKDDKGQKQYNKWQQGQYFALKQSIKRMVELYKRIR